MIDLFHAQPETPEPAPLPVTGQIADALLAGKPRLRLILDSLHIGIVIIDAETHEILTANPRALALLGAPADAVLGRVCHQFICPAEHGKCPITDLGLAVEQSERVLIDADNTRLPIIKSVARISLDGRPCHLSILPSRKRRNKRCANRRSRFSI